MQTQKVLHAPGETTRASLEERLNDGGSGSVYFSAHPVDSLLFQNPDLLHDLYVFKCVTTVVFTSGQCGIAGNYSLSLEHGLETAYAWMTGLPRNMSNEVKKAVEIGKYKLQSWSLGDISKTQVIYLRLPDDASAEQGRDEKSRSSLMNLYNGQAREIATIDGSATYTLDDIRSIIVAILSERQPNHIRVLDHKASSSDNFHISPDEADHIFSARLVMDVIIREKIQARVQV